MSEYSELQYYLYPDLLIFCHYVYFVLVFTLQTKMLSFVIDSAIHLLLISICISLYLESISCFILPVSF